MDTDTGKPKLSEKAKLTATICKAATHPYPTETKSAFHIWDTEVRGFALKITPAGNKTFLVDWRMPSGGAGAKRVQGQYTIGPLGSPWNPDTARQEAKAVLAMAAHHQNPNQLRRDRSRDIVDKAFDKVAE